MITLPPANKVFEKFFLPWYDGAERPSTPRAETYMIKPGQVHLLRADYVGLLSDYLRVTLPEAARANFRFIVSFKQPDLSALTMIDHYYNLEKIRQLIETSDPADFSNDYLAAVSQFGVMLATLFLRLRGFDWQYAHPYFHSVIVHAETGTAIPVFDWALKKFSADGVEYNVLARFLAVSSCFEGRPVVPSL